MEIFCKDSTVITALNVITYKRVYDARTGLYFRTKGIEARQSGVLHGRVQHWNAAEPDDAARSTERLPARGTESGGAVAPDFACRRC